MRDDWCVGKCAGAKCMTDVFQPAFAVELNLGDGVASADDEVVAYYQVELGRNTISKQPRLVEPPFAESAAMERNRDEAELALPDPFEECRIGADRVEQEPAKRTG